MENLYDHLEMLRHEGRATKAASCFIYEKMRNSCLRCTNHQNAEEFIHMSSLIVELLGEKKESQSTRNQEHSGACTLDWFDYAWLFLRFLLKPYRGSQQGVRSHFICHEPLGCLRYDL